MSLLSPTHVGMDRRGFGESRDTKKPGSSWAPGYIWIHALYGVSGVTRGTLKGQALAVSDDVRGVALSRCSELGNPPVSLSNVVAEVDDAAAEPVFLDEFEVGACVRR